MDLSFATITELRSGLDKKKFSAVELARHFLDRIKNHDKKLNAFITVTEEAALEQAKRADKSIADENQTLLTGIPYAAKDLFVTKGIKTTAASKILENYVPPFDSTVVSKLQKSGAVLLGKTNLDQFAHGSSTETSYYGPSRNPWDLDRIPGGSSGGSAAAVAAGLAPLALATETGGSIRQPASLCGISGWKPTYGQVSRYGVIAMSSSMDSMGTVARTVEDLAMSAEIIEVSLPFSAYGSIVYAIVTSSEVSSNLSRYDGIHYGPVTSDANNIFEVYAKSRAEGFGPEAKRRVMTGTYALSAGYREAYYLKAQKVRRLIVNEFNEVFKKVDILLCPSTPNFAPKIGTAADNPF